MIGKLILDREPTKPAIGEVHLYLTAQGVRLPNLKPSTTAISLRLPVTLLERIKVAANKRDIPY